MLKSLFILAIISLLSGCSLLSVSAPVGTGPGLLYQNQNFGGKDGSAKISLKMNTDSKYAVVGPVQAKGSATSILGIVAMGNTGYGLLVKKAKEIGADDVVNLYADTHHTSFLLGMYTKSTVTYYGTAIKYIGKVSGRRNDDDLDVAIIKRR